MSTRIGPRLTARLTPSRRTVWRVPAALPQRSRSDLERRLNERLARYAGDVPEAAFPTFLESLYFESLSSTTPQPSSGKGRSAS